MAALAVLAAVLRMGTAEVPGATLYEWEAIYRDGQVVTYQTSGPVLEFAPREGRPFSLRVSADGGSWSTPSYEIVADPLPADADLDCVVGASDFAVFGQSFGQRCAP